MGVAASVLVIGGIGLILLRRKTATAPQDQATLNKAAACAVPHMQQHANSVPSTETTTRDGQGTTEMSSPCAISSAAGASAERRRRRRSVSGSRSRAMSTQTDIGVPALAVGTPPAAAAAVVATTATDTDGLFPEIQVVHSFRVPPVVGGEPDQSPHNRSVDAWSTASDTPSRPFSTTSPSMNDSDADATVGSPRALRPRRSAHYIEKLRSRTPSQRLTAKGVVEDF
jgi:hypothetical protein